MAASVVAVQGEVNPYPKNACVWPIATNPLPGVWQAVWTPPAYDPRQVRFDLVTSHSIPGGSEPLHFFVYLGLDPGGNPLFGVADGIGEYGSVTIPVVPSPATAAPLTFLFAFRRPARRHPD